jgi:hypothetical protein
MKSLDPKNPIFKSFDDLPSSHMDSSQTLDKGNALRKSLTQMYLKNDKKIGSFQQSDCTIPKRIQKHSSVSSATNHWSKIRIIYQFIVKLKNPDFKKMKRIESLNEDMDEYIFNKIKNAHLFDSNSKRHDSQNFSPKKVSRRTEDKENINESEESVNREHQKIERLMRASKDFDRSKQLFEFASDGSNEAIEFMVQIIKNDIS